MMLGNSIFYLSKGDYRVEGVGFAALDLGLRTYGLKFKLWVVEVEGMGVGNPGARCLYEDNLRGQGPTQA